MKITEISVTEAARNFADCVNRTHYQNASFVLVKNGLPVARIVPVEEKICTGSELAEALTKIQLSAEEAKAWRRDVRAARRALKPQVRRWKQ
jgi:prevent-host-death family protein